MIRKPFSYNAKEIDIRDFPLVFDDILIVPEYSEIETRKEIDVSLELVNLYDEKIKVSLPIINTPHPEIDESNINIFIKNGLIFNVPRFGKYYEKRKEIAKRIKKKDGYVMLSIGLNDFELTKDLIKNKFVDFVCFDLAHGTHPFLLEFLNKLIDLKTIKNINSITIGNLGNIKEYKSLYFKFLKDYNKTSFPKSIKVGIGNGSTCLTRLKTGVGVPQFFALKEFRKTFPDFIIISDGGINYIGDIAKALIYADLVFIGKLLFKCKNITKKIVKKNKFLYNKYFGLSLYKDKKLKSDKDYIEGGKGLVRIEYFNLEELIKDIKQSLQSTLSYCGCNNLYEFKSKVSYYIVNKNTLKENSLRFDND